MKRKPFVYAGGGIMAQIKDAEERANNLTAQDVEDTFKKALEAFQGEGIKKVVLLKKRKR